MPPAALQLTQDETSPDAQVQALVERNQLLAGQPEAPEAPQMFQQGPFSLTGGGPDPSGMIEALKRSGYTGSRTSNIELQPPQQSVEELKQRIDALLGGQR